MAKRVRNKNPVLDSSNCGTVTCHLSFPDLLGTSVQNVSYHVINILKDKGLDENSVIKNYLITASDGKKEWHRDRTTTGTGTGTNDPL